MVLRGWGFWGVGSNGLDLGGGGGGAQGLGVLGCGIEWSRVWGLGCKV